MFLGMQFVENKEGNRMIIRPQYMNKLKIYRDVPVSRSGL